MAKKRNFIFTNKRHSEKAIMGTILGVISMVSSFASELSEKAETRSREKYSQYEEFLSVVVMNDPDTFDDITRANKSQLISIAIWSLIEKNPEPDKYEYVDFITSDNHIVEQTKEQKQLNKNESVFKKLKEKMDAKGKSK